MLIEFFTKHNKLLAAVVILASIGTWSIVGNVVAIVVGLQHCDLFSDEETRSIIPIICYVLGQGQ
ncbi:hypothetical protein [Nitrosopumilus sp.]|uniref:hypothetical protein n=1 Tax=Nitrosopumilus sp. TaxID=2024843 RepID=UPI00293063E4|nr:hypothetical protein [Nitrosopumilus sp.]